MGHFSSNGMRKPNLDDNDKPHSPGLDEIGEILLPQEMIDGILNEASVNVDSEGLDVLGSEVVEGVNYREFQSYVLENNIDGISKVAGDIVKEAGIEIESREPNVFRNELDEEVNVGEFQSFLLRDEMEAVNGICSDFHQDDENFNHVCINDVEFQTSMLRNEMGVESDYSEFLHGDIFSDVGIKIENEESDMLVNSMEKGVIVSSIQSPLYENKVEVVDNDSKVPQAVYDGRGLNTRWVMSNEEDDLGRSAKDESSDKCLPGMKFYAKRRNRFRKRKLPHFLSLEADLKKQKRKIANRESAARSRERKQAECDALELKFRTLVKENNLKEKSLQFNKMSEKEGIPRFQLRRTSSS